MLIDRRQAFYKGIAPPLYLENILDFLWPYRRRGVRAIYFLVPVIILVDRLHRPLLRSRSDDGNLTRYEI